MHRCIKTLLPVSVLALVIFAPVAATAQAEISPIAGFFIGSEISPVRADGEDLPREDIFPRSFGNSLNWGFIGGYYFGEGNLGVEGIFSQSPLANLDINGASVENRVTYGHANVTLQSTGASARVYGTVGLGLGRFRIGAGDGGSTHTKLSVNFGAGVKIPAWQKDWGTMGLRFDVRDFWMRMDADSSMRSNFRQALQLPADTQSGVHNIVTTVGLLFTFN